MTAEARGFPPFPAQPGRRTSRGRTWWAQAWVQALEDTSLDVEQLRRGRRFAGSGRVGAITVSPGRIAAPVYGERDVYDAVVRVEPLTDDEWDRFLTAVAGRAGHLAALLDRDMPHDLVEAAADTGVTLLPGIGDLDPSCSCDAWELPCQHAAALCYQVGWLLDADPFVLLLIRGRTEPALLADLQAHATGSSADGVPAAVAYAGHAPLPATPTELPPPVDAGSLPLATNLAPAVRSAHTEATALPDRADLLRLAADAAARARRLLATARAGELPAELDEWQDTVRLAAEHPDLLDRLSAGDRPTLVRAAEAWRHGGRAGLDALESNWSHPPADLARARTALADDEYGEPRIWRNRLSIGERQIRLGRDGRWYPFREQSGEWWPAGPPAPDPVEAFPP
jgi:uncharacterized Zn finger protein